MNMIGLCLMLTAGTLTLNQCNEQLDEKDVPVTLSADGKTKWIDGSQLPLEGRPFADVERPYRRIPDRLKAVTNVNIGVWKQGGNSAGMLFRFHVAKSSQLKVRWSVVLGELHSRNMSPRSKSGVDFYSWDAKSREWRFAMSAHPTQKDDNEYAFWVPTSGDVMLYLPCYNGTAKFAIGVDPKAEISPVAHRRYGITKPIVFYGTSITQGGCTSRNALAYPAVVSRRLDAPHVNFGFAGNGRMEIEMADLLLEIDASAYVLDCLWNMDDALVERNFEPFLCKLKAAKPDVPLVTVEMCVVENKPNKKSQFIRAVVERLKKEDPAKWANLYHLPAEILFPPDYEGTVDRCHPNDWGMMKMADEMLKVLKPVLANGGKRPLKVLAIGNSYAASLLREMPQVAADMGVKLDLLVANIGGCSMERHVRLMDNPKLDPHARPWSCNYSYADGTRPNLPQEPWNFLRDAILADDWDIITVQQASPDSWRPETYRPWGDSLVGRIRALCPNAEIVVQETWSDHPGGGRLKKWGLTTEEMYARLHSAYADFAKPYGLRIIPTGAAVEKARAFGMMQKSVSDPHLNPAGQFLQGLVWTEKLSGLDVTKGSYVPEGMDAGLAKRLREVAHAAVEAQNAEHGVKTIKAIDEVNEAVIPSERGVKVVAEDDKWDWIDGKDIPMEGRAFEDGLTHYCRLPASAKGKVVGGIWQMCQCSAGLQYRFTTDSRKLKFVWSLTSPTLHSRNVPLCARSGIDVYAWRTKRPDGTVTGGEWWFRCAPTPTGQYTNEYEISWGGEKVPCLINLPLYNGISEFRLGVEKGCRVKPLAVPHRSGVTKPVVFYGGSIVQGASASRPGTCWPNLVGRMLDVPIVNMGFNGQGKMEDVFVDYLASIDASCYVFQNFGNMGIRLAEERYEKFLRALHAKRPDVPLVIGQHCYYLDARGPLHEFAPKLIARIQKEDPEFAKCLYLVRLEDMFAPDSDGTIDGGHPNDWGSMHMAKAFSAIVARALGINNAKQ